MAIKKNVVEPRDIKVLESELERAAYKLLAMGVNPNSPLFKANYGHLNLKIK
jgi:hypothetical protein